VNLFSSIREVLTAVSTNIPFIAAMRHRSDDGGKKDLRNFRKIIPVYKALQPRRQSHLYDTYLQDVRGPNVNICLLLKHLKSLQSSVWSKDAFVSCEVQKMPSANDMTAQFWYRDKGHRSVSGKRLNSWRIVKNAIQDFATFLL
jgi:hypothetical protein